VKRARLVAFALLFAPTAALADGVEGAFDVGYGWLTHQGERATVRSDGGVALGLHLEGRVAERIGLGVSFGWGLADWDRAGEYIAAGNRAGSWTTDKFAQVERWATRKDARQDTRGLRYVALFFADTFLLMSYAAVPVCYMGSVGGATSYLQLDGTVAFHLAPAAAHDDGWFEVGAGAATLPHRLEDWRSAWGPVAGVGIRYGELRLGARLLWSPPAMNEAPKGAVVTGALTVGLVR
jgi:hypothetical protein